MATRKQRRKRGHVPVCPHCHAVDAWFAAGRWTCRKCHGDYALMRETLARRKPATCRSVADAEIEATEHAVTEHSK